jgi:shikimate kinase
MNDKIILLGYMGVGKSTIGKLLAQKTGKSFFDLDEIISQQEGKSISDLFASKGEIYFRKVEHQVLQAVLDAQSNFVLSLGGGTPCYAQNHLLYARTDCQSIYLKASISTLQERAVAERTQRPILRSIPENELEEFIAKQLFERSYYYNQTSFTVHVDQKSPAEICQELIKILG